MAFTIIYITHPDQETAREISRQLIDDRLVACANIFPIESAYWWEGNVQEEGEFVSIVKTRNELVPSVEKIVMKLHPYDVPCIMQIEVKANKSYEDWIFEQTR